MMNLFMMVKSTLKHFGFIKLSSGLCDGENCAHELRFFYKTPEEEKSVFKKRIKTVVCIHLFFYPVILLKEKLIVVQATILSPSQCLDEGLIKPKHLNVEFAIINNYITLGLLWFYIFFIQSNLFS